MSRDLVGAAANALLRRGGCLARHYRSAKRGRIALGRLPWCRSGCRVGGAGTGRGWRRSGAARLVCRGGAHRSRWSPALGAKRGGGAAVGPVAESGADGHAAARGPASADDLRRPGRVERLRRPRHGRAHCPAGIRQLEPLAACRFAGRSGRGIYRARAGQPPPSRRQIRPSAARHPPLLDRARSGAGLAPATAGRRAMGTLTGSHGLATAAGVEYLGHDPRCRSRASRRARRHPSVLRRHFRGAGPGTQC